MRSALLALAIAALVFSADAVLAGGHGGNSKSHTQNVRIKNIGARPVLVNAKNGHATTGAGAKTVTQNGVAQFRLKNIPSQAWAADVSRTVRRTLNYSFPGSQFVYLEAAADGTTTTLTYAPPGKIF